MDYLISFACRNAGPEKQTPGKLDPESRRVVLKAVQRTCERHAWVAHCIHVRSHRVHAIVGAPCSPELVGRELKANASAALSRTGLTPPGRWRWAPCQTACPLISSEALWAAITYVADEQGEQQELYLRPPTLCRVG